MAPIRLAYKRSRSGLIALSYIVSRYQEGMLFHTAASVACPKIPPKIGFCYLAELVPIDVDKPGRIGDRAANG